MERDGVMINVCESCLATEAGHIAHCPNCGAQAQEHEEVGLVLTPKGSSPAEKATAPEVLCIVCPQCHILYFDKFSYELIRGLQRR